MFDNLPEVDEDELIEKHQIPQENYRRYLELRAEPIFIFRKYGRRRPWCPPDGYVEGYGYSGNIELFEEAARGNLRRLMPEIVFRSRLAESTIYKILKYEGMKEDVIQDFEWALYDMLLAADFDLPTEQPDLENLSEWLQRWVGSFVWIADFVGVKSNTLVAGLRRSADWQERCLEFARRWYAARCRQYQRVSQELLEKRYVDFLETRERKAAMLLEKAQLRAEASYRKAVEEWEVTPAARQYLKDVSTIGETAALKRCCELYRTGPPSLTGVRPFLRSGLYWAEEDYQSAISDPPDHLYDRPLFLIIVQPPGEVEDLWPQN